METSRNEKKKWTSNKVPFGYKKERGWLKVDEKLEEVVREVFDIFIQTENYTETARKTNEEFGDILDREMRYPRVRFIVTNPVYKGEPRCRSGEEVSDSSLVIVDPKTWREAQRIVQEKREGGIDWREVLKVEEDEWSSEHDSVDRLLKHLARKSKSRSSLRGYCSTLGRLCDHFGITPDQLIETEGKRLEKMLKEFLDGLEANSTANTQKYRLKSFFEENGRENIQYPQYGTIKRVPAENEYIPYPEEVEKMMECATTLKSRAIIGVISGGGVRPSTLRAVRYGKDAKKPQLRTSTVKEEIENGEENLLINVFPAMKDLVDQACKNSIPHYTFLAEFATEAVRDYLEERERESGPIRDEEFLFPSGDNSLPKEERVLKPLGRTSIDNMIKEAARKARIDEWRFVKAKSLRKFFNNILKDCKEVPDEDKEYLMGHVIPGSREAYYDRSKVGKTRKKFSEADFIPSNRSENKGFLEKMARFHGLDYEKVVEEARQIYGKDIGNEEFEEYLRRKVEQKKKSRKKQIIVPVKELKERLSEGWRYVDKLSSGEIIIEKEKGIWEMIENGEEREATPK